MASNADDSLFRSEVLEARRQRVHGEIILSAPVRSGALSGLLFVVIASLAIWICLGRYTRSENAPGMMVTDKPSAKVMVGRPGVVTRLAAHDGQYVSAGQILAVVQTESGDEAGRSTVSEGLQALAHQRDLMDQQADLARVRAVNERERLRASIEGVRRQSADLSRQIELQREVVGSSQNLLRGIEAVLERGYVSRVEVERRRQAALVAQQQLSQLEQQFAALATQERQARAEIARADTDSASAIASAGANGAALAQQGATLRGERAYTVRAPISGIVTALEAAPGRAVTTGAPLMVVVPRETALHADVYAPTRAVGFIKPGQEVRLLYDAFPYQRFGSFKGRITRISRIVLDPRDLTVPMKIEEAVYRIEVAPEQQAVDAFGDRLRLQPGMTLTANIILDRRSFADWLLEPLNAVLKRSS